MDKGNFSLTALYAALDEQRGGPLPFRQSRDFSTSR